MKNPFDAVQRPYIDPDYSPTPGYTEVEWARLLVTARDHHRIGPYRKRAYALLLMLYTCCLRVDSLLSARVEDLGYDKGHRVLLLENEGRRPEEEADPARGLGRPAGLPRRPRRWLAVLHR
ncbi:hypothetical protein AB0907_39370 [Streptomyces sp. NPDC006975]|uniref:hypothetical protein n=1 Tax=Streptomyces sp. NPDC006975 TaxID=3154310 RepID=UPI0034568A78